MVELSLTSSIGGEIRYTTNETEPSLNSTIYLKPLPIYHFAGLIIKSKIFLNSKSSPTVTNNYSYSLIQTSQSICYNNVGGLISCTGTKHDGDIKAGVIRNYLDEQDGTVKDNYSGLFWQKCSRGQSGSSCSIGLITQHNFSDAETYCAGLNLGNKTWRLPTITELANLIDFSTSSPSIRLIFFPLTSNSDKYWTTTNYSQDTSKNWTINFGSVVSQPESKSGFLGGVKCISGLASSESTYMDMGDGTIKNIQNNLLWQKCTRGQSGTNCEIGVPTSTQWGATVTDAIGYCNALSLAGKTWRLPNINELRSITDYTKISNPTVNSIFFPSTLSNIYWSSTCDTGQARIIDFNVGFSGGIGFTPKTNSYFTRCVSGP